MELTEQQIDKLVDEVSGVLCARFADKSKRKIYKYKERLNFACPYCGDSVVDKHKKRGNVYYDRMEYHCFNCGKHTDYFSFMKDWGHMLSLERMDEIGDVATTRRGKKAKAEKPEMIKRFSENAVSRKLLKEKFSLVEPNEDVWCSEYLQKRCMQPSDKHFLYNQKKNELCVLNINECGDVLGMQIRSFKVGDVKYKTYINSKLRKCCGMEIVGDKEMFDSLSTIYNIALVDLLKRVFVFEGGIDSFILPNSIAICGAKRNMPMFIRKLPDVCYFFDNDETGQERAIKELKLEHNVFMWSKYLNERGINDKIKDLNDLLVWAKTQNKMSVFEGITNYFTNDMLDIADI